MSEFLKIGFLADSLSRGGGGLVEVQIALAKCLVEAGHEVAAFGLRDKHFELDQSKWSPIHPQAAKGINLLNIGFSSELRRNVMMSNCEILHLHTLWKYSSAIVTEWSRKKSLPYIVSPHGMLDPWARKNSGIKKAIARYLYEDRMLRHAACIHVFTEKEKDVIRKMGLVNHVAVIPNGVNVADYASIKRVRHESAPRIMLYLGRLHPKKGLPMLLRAWRAVMTNEKSKSHNTWSLAIAGWDQNSHEQELKAICDEMQLSRSDECAEQFLKTFAERKSFPDVSFLGPAFGDVKSNLYGNADAFVLPSLSEGLPMTVLEAWASKLPVLMTQDCNLVVGEKAGAAIVCKAAEESIRVALQEFKNFDTAHLSKMGENGRHLVECNYQWKELALKLAGVYRWLLNDGPKPMCVES